MKITVNKEEFKKVMETMKLAEGGDYNVFSDNALEMIHDNIMEAENALDENVAIDVSSISSEYEELSIDELIDYLDLEEDSDDDDDVIINTLEKETSVIGVIDSVKEPTTVIFKTF